MYLDYDVLRTTCMSVLNVEKRCNGFSIEDFNRVNEFSLNLFSSIFVQSMYSMLFRFSKNEKKRRARHFWKKIGPETIIIFCLA